MRSTYNNFLLDGLDNNAYGTSNQGYSAQLVQLSPDALAEFKVITSNYSAEYGRVGGAVVNAVMKSGTNQFHGTAYEYLRNTSLNATGFLFSPAVFVKPTLQRNQFGATIGAPVVKNKVFFFGDYEGFRQLQRYLNFDSIPSMTDRVGVLPVSVVNPLTNVVYPANTTDPHRAVEPLRSLCSEQPAADQWSRTIQQRRSAPVDQRLRRQIRRQARRPDQRSHDGIPAFQPAQGPAVLRTRPHRAIRRGRQRPHPRNRSERFGGLHLDRHANLGLPGSLGLLPYRCRQESAVCRRPQHGFHVRRLPRPADHPQLSPADSIRRLSAD